MFLSVMLNLKCAGRGGGLYVYIYSATKMRICIFNKNNSYKSTPLVQNNGSADLDLFPIRNYCNLRFEYYHRYSTASMLFVMMGETCSLHKYAPSLPRKSTQ